jgi:signal peptidase I
MCFYDYPLDLPPTVRTATRVEAHLSALDEANSLQGRGCTYYVLNTRSMEPALWGGDYIVVESVPYSQLQRGDIIAYWADWLPGNVPVTHRLVEKDRGGWILSGDNNRHSESYSRVTEANYIGKLVRVYRPSDSTKEPK